MSKIKEAKEILTAFKLSSRQQNDRSARVLLSLLHLKENQPWSESKNDLIGIHDMIIFISDNYNFPYAENSRESIRKQSIHQFEQAGIIVRNIDDPSGPTNSGKTVYSITDEALEVLRSFKTKEWETKIKYFLINSSSLLKKYERLRNIHKVSVKIRGEEYLMSPGKHNELQKLIIEEFGSRFAKDSLLVYVGDTSKKHLYLDKKYCTELKIDITQHDKLPDIVMYNRDKNWLYLIEAVTTHGPVSPKRVIEIKEMLKKSSVLPIFVSAFPDFKTFQKYAKEISWETEVWVANSPDHMIHFNGDKFLGPH